MTTAPLVWVLLYETAECWSSKEAFHSYYDEIEICEEATRGHYKSTHKYRNQIMVNRSDLVIFCIQNPSGGAWQTMQDAQGKEKHFRSLKV